MMQQQQQSSVRHEDLLTALRSIVPELNHESYKGQSGKVGVMGGCMEYTGAPYFAAMSAMRMGADLAYVFCTPSAAPVIKGYSPELIVIPMLPETTPGPQSDEHPLLVPEDEYVSRCRKKGIGFIERLSVLIIGPGLGDDPEIEPTVTGIIYHARERNLPLIIDGSGLNIIAKQPKLVQGYSNCILTPNIAEFGRLAQGAGVKLEGAIGTNWQQQAQQLAAALDGPLLLSKGQVDVITDGRQQLVVTADGSPRRCGGQGDVLTGTIASFISWQKAAKKQQQQQQDGSPAAALLPLMIAAYGGCLAMRAAAVLKYAEKGRSMVAGDMLDALGDPVLQHCGLLPAGMQPATKL